MGAKEVDVMVKLKDFGRTRITARDKALAKLLGKEAEGRTRRVARMVAERGRHMQASDAFLLAAGASILTSLALRGRHREDLSLFVGQWAPTFLILGLYGRLMREQD